MGGNVDLLIHQWLVYLALGLGGAQALVHLLELALDGSVRGGAVFHSIAEGEAWKGFVVACFDCGKPGGRDWVTSRSVVETQES